MDITEEEYKNKIREAFKFSDGKTITKVLQEYHYWKKQNRNDENFQLAKEIFGI